MTNMVDIEGLKEAMKLLREAGMEPMLCNKAVPVSGKGVPCGPPTEVGDQDIEDYILLPKSLGGAKPEMLIPVQGDSMVDAGFYEGDLLRVRFNVPVQDGDNVLVSIDGACTTKTLFTDEEGTKWLVPQNEKYDAIQLTEDMNVWFMGLVLGVEKTSVRASSRSLLQSIRRTKNKIRAARKLTDEEVDELIVQIAEEVLHARQWFSVYKALVEYEVQQAGDYSGFCARVRTLLPEHGHLPEAKEVGRMEVDSFAKNIAMWDERNAPVKGSRFRDYRRIALLMAEYLSAKGRK